MDRPAEMFDREYEWSRLAAFAVDSRAGGELGVVWGRRRQGKTFLLRALCQATGGFYFAADEATDAESLRRIGAALPDHVGAPGPLQFDEWHPVVDALLALGDRGTIPAVIHGFPYLARPNPSLPSLIHNPLAPLPPERART